MTSNNTLWFVIAVGVILTVIGTVGYAGKDDDNKIQWATGAAEAWLRDKGVVVRKGTTCHKRGMYYPACTVPTGPPESEVRLLVVVCTDKDDLNDCHLLETQN